MDAQQTPVFISWSGPRSRQVAMALREWLPRVLQTAKPWMSEKDIDVGSMWFDEIGFSVLDARFAIICLTPENIAGTWLHFEAGAIGMRRDEEGKRRPVAPYLLELEPKNLPHPLAFFNARNADREGTLAMVQSLNKQLVVPLSDEVLESTFEVWWPKLEEALSEIPKPVESAVESTRRSGDEVLEEILSLVRSLALQTTEITLSPKVSEIVVNPPPNKGDSWITGRLARVTDPTDALRGTMKLLGIESWTFRGDRDNLHVVAPLPEGLDPDGVAEALGQALPDITITFEPKQ